MAPLNELITDDEKAMLARIAKIAGYTPKEHGYLEDIFQTIKIQGSAYHIDIAPLMGLGIPVYHELAKIRNVEVSEISRLLADDHATFQEIKQGFINLTSEGIYSPE
jgi:hypothetical protein